MGDTESSVEFYTVKLLDWLQSIAKINQGEFPPFTNNSAMTALGKNEPKNFGRQHGQIQSRIDFACFLSNLPPLGLAANIPFKNAWLQENRDWAFPIEQMMVAAQTRKWSDVDFDRIRSAVVLLPKSASLSWRKQLTDHPDDVKNWACSFTSTIGTPRINYIPPKQKSLAKKRIDWTRDELILALELYLNEYRDKAPDDKHKKIIVLSELLNQLARVLGIQTTDTYRNPNGVAMKLMNFRSIDPSFRNAGKTGLKQGSKLDTEVWMHYAGNTVDLAQIAQAIKAGISQNKRKKDLTGNDEPGIQEAPEGKLLTRTHRFRERDPKLAVECKRRALKLKGRLFCEACGFDFGKQYGEDAAHIIDCHHIKPVHTLTENSKTHINDLELLCSNCHRMVHSFKPWLSSAKLKERLTQNYQAYLTTSLL